LGAGSVHEYIQPYSVVVFVETQPGNRLVFCEGTALTAEQPDTFAELTL
jgi:hypothetical protein